VVALEGPSLEEDGTAAQLALIEELSRLLTDEATPHWLFGGWAVDFVVGRVTRPHRDIEFVVWWHDAERLPPILGEHEYEVRAREEEAITFIKQGQHVEFYVIVRDARGRLITPGRWANWPWLDGSFDGPRGRIGEVVCPVVSVETQLDTKEAYLRHTGVPLRSKDRADIASLRGLRGG
jgi:hypothetical protein